MSATFSKPLTHRHISVSQSTNTELLTGLHAGVIDHCKPYLLTASQQTAGRGQHGRTWQSPRGNVYLSLYSPLTLPISGLLSLVVGYHLTRLPIIQAINRQRRQRELPPIGVKWANDIGFYDSQADNLIASSPVASSPLTPHHNDHSHAPDALQTLMFNKLAGILIEPAWVNNQVTGVVVGVGFNIACAPALTTVTQEGLNYQAISLKQLMLLDKAASPFVNQPVIGPQAQDFYLPICNAILKAMSQFSEFTYHPYSFTQFMNDYATANALAGHRVMVQQPLSHVSQGHPSQRSPMQPLPTLPAEKLPFKKQSLVFQKPSATTPPLIIGHIVAINPDGSLQIVQDNNQKIDIYTGNISVLHSSS